jgi:hypothetical protein
MNMNNDLQGKRILFIGQVFYDYHKRIVAELEAMGGEVVFFENKMFREDPVLYPKDLISRVKRLLNPEYKNSYNAAILGSIQNTKFDVLFCIGGFSLSIDFIEAIKENNPGIKSIIYFWDAFKVWPFAHLIPAFDEVYTFERSDAVQYDVNYLPLFFSKRNDVVIPGIAQRTRDLLYVGSVGPMSINRFKLLALFDALCKKQDLNYLLYLLYTKPKHSRLIKLINKVRGVLDQNYRTFANTLQFYKSTQEFVKDKPLSSAELDALFLDTKCVIDIQVPSQTGLTMRTIESLALGCKLLTTNPSITQEPFFDPDWIQVISEPQILPDLSFLRKIPDKSIDIESLSLDNWLKNMIADKRA